MSDPRDDDNAISPLLYNLEAEQMLLGAVMFENSLFAHIDMLLSDKLFYEPLHGRMWRVIAKSVGKGEALDPLVMRDALSIDKAFYELGGLKYLIDLVDRCRTDVGAIVACARLIRSAFFRRQVIKVAKIAMDRAQSTDDVDGGVLLADMEKDMSNIRVGKDDAVAQSAGSVAAKIVEGFDRVDSDKSLIKTGLAKIDNVIGAMEKKDLIVLAARPSMGKSALSNVIGRYQAQGGAGVLVINGEMTPEQMTRRLLTDVAFDTFSFDAPEYRKIKQQKLTDREKEIIRETAQVIARLPMELIKRNGLPLAKVRSIARKQKMIFMDMGIDLNMLIVDHVGLIKGDEHYQNRVQEQTMVSGGMKEIADELDCVVLALAQLSRECEKREDKRPQLADLRDSGSWEQDADVVLGVYRDSYYARREQEPKTVAKQGDWVLRCGSKIIEVIALKVREGDLGTAKLWADIGRNVIRDKDPEAFYNDPYGDN